ncbi:MAG TPA: hypothetical protein VKD72_27480, partial [Gemmataceae bacterium]|nr:hypothetical protein [Gemmataceae bacterium]
PAGHPPHREAGRFACRPPGLLEVPDAAVLLRWRGPWRSHEAAARGLDLDGTVNAFGRELDELADALGLDE